MAKRACKLQDSACIIDSDNDNIDEDHNHTSFMGSEAVLFMPSIHQNHNIPSVSFHVMQQQQQHRHPPSQVQQQQPLQYYNSGESESGYESMDWIFGCKEGLFNNNQGLMAQLA